VTVSAPVVADDTASDDTATREGASSGAVFVLCGGRSGSTLLRFLLDAHPDLACPPETNVPALCGQLATVWSLIEGAPLSANRGDEPPEIPEAAIAGVRHMMDMMVGSYLERRGKKRYCDKSLGTARFVELLTRVYPDAKFICLYRHPMDVIASGLEACPWGLNGYGFDPYIASTPGNSVLAMARFWADNASAILRAEELFPDHCHRVRYEDMVSDPEAVAAGIFEFLGVPPAPGVSANCFAPSRERFGPADYKIWHTSKITDDSVGRGWSIPAGLMGPDMQAAVNELAGKLGYLPVDDSWGTKEPPADLRLPADSPEPETASDGSDPAGGTDRGAVGSGGPSAAAGEQPAAADEPAAEGRRMGELLATGLDRMDERFNSRWSSCSDDAFCVIVLPAAKAKPPVRWRVDLAARAITCPAADNDDTAWDIIGTADVWDELVSDRLNFSVAMRRCQIRYLDSGEAPPAIHDIRIGMLADLLGLTSW
jgi:Sulfotransferase family